MQSNNIETLAEEYFQKALSFINSIGIAVRFEHINETVLLPGIYIHEGVIVVDLQKLLYPGDILHEAGHIAVVPLAERNSLNNESIGLRKDAPAEEMMAIAWSYAACMYLEIPASFVFHNQGYQGGGTSLADNFREGRYIGVPMLQFLGLCMQSNNQSDGYPSMLRWVVS